MKKLLLVAAIAAVVAQDTYGAANNAVLKCPAGYSYNRAKGQCQRLLGPNGTRQALPANVNAKFVRPAMNTRGGIQKQNIGGNSATWAPALNTRGGIQPVAKPAMNTRGGIQKQNIGGNPATWAPVLNTRGGIQPVAKPAMNTQGGVRKLIGGNSGGSY